ncbi:hypothetical protein [Geminicoccus harenae]|nr:hypothetical protein [Geminicoccus harenae]
MQREHDTFQRSIGLSQAGIMCVLLWLLRVLITAGSSWSGCVMPSSLN